LCFKRVVFPLLRGPLMTVLTLLIQIVDINMKLSYPMADSKKKRIPEVAKGALPWK
jgi:hypothetical protein